MKTPTKHLMVGIATSMVLGLSSIAFAALDTNADPNIAAWDARRSQEGSNSLNSTVSAAGTGDNCPLCKMARDQARAKLAAAYEADVSAEGKRGQ